MKLKRFITILTVILLVFLQFPINGILAINENNQEKIDTFSSEEDPSELDETSSDTMYFQRVTSFDQFQLGKYYVVTNEDITYSLNAGVENGTYASPVNLPGDEDLLQLMNVDLDVPSNIFYFSSKIQPDPITQVIGNYFRTGPDSDFYDIKLDSSGIFYNWNEAGAGNVSFTPTDQNNDLWLIQSVNNRSLTFSGDSYNVTNSSTVPGTPVAIWVNVPEPKDPSTYFRYDNISGLDNLGNNNFIITLPSMQSGKFVPDSYIIAIPGSYNSWYVPTSKSNPESDFTVDNGWTVTVNPYSDISPFLTAQTLTSGDITNDPGTFYKYNTFTATNRQVWYPNYLTSTSSPFTNYGTQSNGEYPNRSVRLEYMLSSTGSTEIYLRGNSDSSWLGYVEGVGFVACTQDGAYYTGRNADGDSQYSEDGVATLVPIRIYISGFGDESATESVTVEYFDSDQSLDQEGYGYDQIMSLSTKGYLPLNAPTTSVLSENSDYIFLGWSTNPALENEDGIISSYLSDNQSTNLYDTVEQEDGSEISGYTPKALGYDLVGTGDGAGSNVTEESLQDVVDDGVLKLYAIYAVHGYDTVITANEGSTPIVGISDWKAGQGGSAYQDLLKEKWLGSIIVNVYRDGVPWVQGNQLYFSYHNDDAADLNIKFIWDNLLEAEEELGSPDPLRTFMANVGDQQVIKQNGQITEVIPPESDNEAIFPPHSQIGHYVIDAAYATQGGSEDGLVYGLNWIQSNGGQLDNVIGGTVVNLYVTSIYNAEYYLVDAPYGTLPTNDDLIYKIEGTDWNNPENYATDGTMELFNTMTSDVNYDVTDSNYSDLLLPGSTYETVDGINDYTFNSGNLSRGGASEFSYLVKTYENIIPVAPKPTDSSTFTQLGKSLASQSNNDWLLIGPKGQTEIEYDGDISLEDSTYYGTGEYTGYAIPTIPGEFNDGLAPYTFNLYAFLAQEPGTTPPGTTPTPPANTIPNISIVKQQSQGTGSPTKNQLTALAGSKINYYLTVSNTGNGAATNLQVTDTLPTGMTLVNGSISNNGVYSSSTRTITWNIPTLAADSSITLQFSVTIPASVTTAMTYTNVGTVIQGTEKEDSNPVVVKTPSVQQNVTPENPTTPSTPSTPSSPNTNTTTTVTTVTSNPKTGLDVGTNYILAILISGAIILSVIYMFKRKTVK